MTQNKNNNHHKRQVYGQGPETRNQGIAIWKMWKKPNDVYTRTIGRYLEHLELEYDYFTSANTLRKSEIPIQIKITHRISLCKHPPLVSALPQWRALKAK